MTNSTERVVKSIKNRDAHIGVIGLGYVGLPLIIRFSEEGYKTIGFDIDKNKVTKLNAGQSYIKNFTNEKIASIINNGFIATIDFNKITNVDAIIICVPTPLKKLNEPDLSFIKNTLNTIKPFLKENQILILESTTYPGTTEEEIVPLIINLGFEIGKNYFVGYSPEREDPGNKKYTTKNIPKVVSGYTSNCLEVTKLLYNSIVNETVPVSSTRVAEMTKILENIHRAVNIGLVNELKMVADKMDIDIYEVISAAATKPFGFTPYYPGPGLGGHCIPIDPFYLSWKAKQVGIETRFIELAGKINSSMPGYVVQKVCKALENAGKAIINSRILVLGLAYKKNLDDARESPSLTIINILNEMGAEVQYSDPYFPEAPITRKYKLKLSNVAITKEIIKNFDLVLLSTDHDEFDYNLIYNEAKLIVDTRNRFQKTEKVIKA